MLGRVAGMLLGVEVMPVRYVCMVSPFRVLSIFIVLCCFVVVLGRLFRMMCSVLVVFCMFFGHKRWF